MPAWLSKMQVYMLLAFGPVGWRHPLCCDLLVNIASCGARWRTCWVGCTAVSYWRTAEVARECTKSAVPDDRFELQVSRVQNAEDVRLERRGSLAGSVNCFNILLIHNKGNSVIFSFLCRNDFLTLWIFFSNFVPETSFWKWLTGNTYAQFLCS